MYTLFFSLLLGTYSLFALKFISVYKNDRTANDTCIISAGVAQWIARLTRNVEVVGSSPIKGPCCFLEQETLPLLLSTGWFQERIRA